MKTLGFLQKLPSASKLLRIAVMAVVLTTGVVTVLDTAINPVYAAGFKAKIK